MSPHLQVPPGLEHGTDVLFFFMHFDSLFAETPVDTDPNAHPLLLSPSTATVIAPMVLSWGGVLDTRFAARFSSLLKTGVARG